ncbi:MAG: peptide chain release factor 2 [Gammaproteobacteria bacterium]|nr:peptide chain release factor 2 [Gammaproteobacteria bacterium]
MAEITSVRERIKDLSQRDVVLRGYLDFENKLDRLEEVERELALPNIWDDPERAQGLNKERANLDGIIKVLSRLHINLADLAELAELAADEADGGTLKEIDADLDRLETDLAALEFQRMFDGEMDAANAFVEIQSGAGGTEAQDWAEMLLRMYLRWGEKRGFTVEIIELSPGDIAGITGATVRVSGDYAFGWLRTETGVHRLVRKSPFDSGNRRHTSFASVFVSPEIEDDIEININPADVRVDTYRASGAGGQHVNRTDSAVRLTHLPTNTVVQCQSERSQHQNKDNAFKQLRAKLYELEELKRREKQQAVEDSKADIGWGSQIRSYVLDQSRVKDERTKVERSDPGNVLDGDLDGFIEASLKAGL